MKRVLVALRLQGIAGQEKLSGIFRYLGDTPEWDVRFIRSAQEFTAARVKTAIAIRCGYENPNYLKNLFKRRFAMTMREFRNRS